MQRELSFVPLILLCGDEEEFISRVGNRPFKIVGHVQFFGEVNGQTLDFLQDGKIFLNGEFQHFNDFLNLLRNGSVDYLVFNSPTEALPVHGVLKSSGLSSSKILTAERFKFMPLDFFYDRDSDLPLLEYLQDSAVKSLLDVDGFFAKGQLFTTTSYDVTEIDCILKEPLLPIKANLYRRVFKDFSEVGFRRYDAALLVERPSMDFLSAFIFLENFTDRVIVFARTNSELEKFILDSANNFSTAEYLSTATGNWFFLSRRKPPEDFCMYVVTHKATPHEGKLPDGYKMIHAGHALATETFGDLGDDTGDNISELNPYLNEITALYWMWKNTSHTTIGLSHYRRFFTTGDETFSYDKILTQDDALKILERYDIAAVFHHDILNQREISGNNCNFNFVKICEAVIKKHLVQTHPDYLDAFSYMMNSTTFYKCNMFVTRRNIFDAYCKWLFSFYLDAMKEVLLITFIKDSQGPIKRTMAFLAERTFPAWLIKNRLRVKELNIMELKNL